MSVDWRDFFPLFKWLPNQSVEGYVRDVDFKRNAIINALLREQRKRLANLEVSSCKP
jgi:ent-kaurene oxidase